MKKNKEKFAYVKKKIVPLHRNSKNKKFMKKLYIIIFKTKNGDKEYSLISNYYFYTEQDARKYARDFVERSNIFSIFEIKDIMHF